MEKMFFMSAGERHALLARFSMTEIFLLAFWYEI